MGETIRIQNAVGDTKAYLAPAQSTPEVTVLLLHPWWGLNQTIRDLADRLAGDGFTVMAPDLFDGTVLAASSRRPAGSPTWATSPNTTTSTTPPGWPS